MAKPDIPKGAIAKNVGFCSLTATDPSETNTGGLKVLFTFASLVVNCLFAISPLFFLIIGLYLKFWQVFNLLLKPVAGI